MQERQRSGNRCGGYSGLRTGDTNWRDHFGRVSVPDAHELSDGSELRVTVARWFAPNGYALEDGLSRTSWLKATVEDLEAHATRRKIGRWNTLWKAISVWVGSLRWQAKKKGQGPRSIATNRKALHDYFIIEKHEAGIVLTGSEIKSIRAGRVNLRDSYVRITNASCVGRRAYLAYDQASRENHDPLRERKLLMHRKENNRLQDTTQAKGLTIVPLRMYFSDSNHLKVEIALARESGCTTSAMRSPGAKPTSG